MKEDICDKLDRFLNEQHAAQHTFDTLADAVKWSNENGTKCLGNIVDLKTGKIVSTCKCSSRIHPNGKPTTYIRNM